MWGCLDKNHKRFILSSRCSVIRLQPNKLFLGALFVSAVPHRAWSIKRVKGGRAECVQKINFKACVTFARTPTN
ncbi:MAG: hypothetical protein B7X12_10830 [Halothiobacillus sp. 20-53-49]|nr:MAG: hypothetical protein B7X12_10830 [Halothiobacillus sp. 20-53-49]